MHVTSKSLTLAAFAAANLGAAPGAVVGLEKEPAPATKGRVVGRELPPKPKYPDVTKGTIGRSTKDKRRKLAKLLHK